MSISFEDFKKNKKLPSDAQLVTNLDGYIPYSEYKKLYDTDKKNSELRFKVICDNPVWVAASPNCIFSFDGKVLHTLKFKSQCKNLLCKVVSEKGDVSYMGPKPLMEPDLVILEDDKVVNNNSKEKDGIKMENNFSDFEKTLENAAKQEGASDIKEATFGDQQEVIPDALSQRNAELDKIAEETSVIKDLSEINAVGYQLNKFIGHVTQNENILKVGAATIYETVEHDGKKVKVLKDNVSPEIQEAYAVDVSSVDKENFKSTKVVRYSMSKPGAKKGLILKMSAQTLVPLSDLTGNSEEKAQLVPNVDPSLFEVVVLPIDKANLLIQMINGGAIKESQITHPMPEEYRVKLKNTTVTKDGEKTPTTKLVGKTTRKTEFTEENWFPRRVTKKISLADARADKGGMRKQADLSLHAQFVNTASFEGLTDKSAFKVEMYPGTESKVVTSDLLQPNSKIKLEVKSPFTGEIITNPSISLREFKVRGKNNDKYTGSLIAFDIMKPKREVEELSPEKDKRFSAIREACDGKLNATLLEAIFPKTGTGKAKKEGEYSGSAAQRIIMQEIGNKSFSLGGTSKDGITNGVMEELNNKIKSMKLERMAAK